MQSDAAIRECILHCREASEECQETLVDICLPKGGKYVKADHVKLMVDCIQICQMAADFMTRNSEYHAAICTACAEICNACADSCEALGEDMLPCVEACRLCARTCSNMGESKAAA